MKKTIIIIIGIVLILYIFIQFALEPIIKNKINKELADLEEYHGQVQGVNIDLIGGNYSIDSFMISSKNVKSKEDHLFVAQSIRTHVLWKEIFKGRVVGELLIIGPIVNFIYDGKKVDDAESLNLKKILNEITPFKIELLNIQDGELHYKDPTVEPKIDLFIKQFQLMGQNLGNIQQSEKVLPSHIQFSGQTIGGGGFTGNMDLNLIKKIPDFDLELKIDSLKLTALNDFTDAYANFTFEGGEMFMGSEMVMKDGVYQGYVKPVFENIKILDVKDEDNTLLEKAWEAILEFTTKVFENPESETFATRIPFEGDMNETDAKILPTIFNVFKNAFVEAFTKDIDGMIDFDNFSKEK
jgi:hypothetical protein